MIEVLQFMFSSFWTFVGCLLLLNVVARVIIGLARAIMRVPITNITNNTTSSE